MTSFMKKNLRKMFSVNSEQRVKISINIHIPENELETKSPPTASLHNLDFIHKGTPVKGQKMHTQLFLP